MTTAALKKKIKALVDKETSEGKLAKAYKVLVGPPAAASEPEEAYKRIKLAEADFAAGRFMSGDEVKAKLKTALKKRRAAKKKAA
ncbi:MAG: hypothetical protein IPM46_13065 [Flavobacteriales bacterium]|nr:hypothetical protein [Flavobacteriales bacterium]